MAKKSIKELLAQVVTALKDVQIVTGTTTGTPSSSSATMLLYYNGSMIQGNQYDVISAYCNGYIVFPFVSNGAWYAKIVAYSNLANVTTSVTVAYTLRKKV